MMRHECTLLCALALALATADGRAASPRCPHEATPRFEKIALIDSYDFVRYFDCETKTGTVQVVENVAGQVGATHLLWRHQTGGIPRYPSAEESSVIHRMPFEKRVVEVNNIHGWSDLAKGETNLLAYAIEQIAAHGFVAGIHHTWEENHFQSRTCSQWNLDHPEYSTRSLHGIARPGYTSSLAYEEVLAHKLRRFDEVLSTGPSMIYIDMWRQGGWYARLEYVKPMCDRWRSRYGCEPPEDASDERWLALVAECNHRYIRAMRARMDATGRPMQLVLGIPYCDLEDKELWRRYAVDWKALAADGTVDAISVMSVRPDEKRIWDSTREIYEYVYRNRGRAKVYFPVSQYNFTFGIPSYCKATGLKGEEVAARLLDLAASCGGAGVTFECVDMYNYTDAMREVIRRFHR
ncbi:MAG: hypothetical protein IKO72_04610 [Kiritimatiellae bacterium]|nr:hypothetical protein [Kiritimatiellia bacterium]